MIPKNVTSIEGVLFDGMVVKADGMLPTMIAAKSLGYKKVSVSYDPLILFHLLEDLECIVVSHARDVLKSGK